MINCILLGHNYTFGVTILDEFEQKITKNIFNAGLLLEISVVDYLLITDGGFDSFAEYGAL